MSPAPAPPKARFSPLAAWRDWRLSRLDDRAFCRRVSLEGWDLVASAAEDGRGSLILVRGEGLPHTAARALRLFARARPAGAGGAVTYLPAAATPPPGDYALLEATAEATAAGALVSLRATPSKT